MRSRAIVFVALALLAVPFLSSMRQPRSKHRRAKRVRVIQTQPQPASPLERLELERAY